MSLKGCQDLLSIICLSFNVRRSFLVRILKWESFVSPLCSCMYQFKCRSTLLCQISSSLVCEWCHVCQLSRLWPVAPPVLCPPSLLLSSVMLSLCSQSNRWPCPLSHSSASHFSPTAGCDCEATCGLRFHSGPHTKTSALRLMPLYLD